MDLPELVTRTLARRSGPEEPLRIVQAGHPALRGAAREWTGQLDDALLAELVDAMVLTMREAPGVGLAAPQVGIPLRLAVLEDAFDDAEDGDGDEFEDGFEDGYEDPLDRRPLPLRTVLNPTYEAVGSGRVYYWEGCLSVDGWQSIVPRAETIRARGLQRRTDGTIEEFDEEWTGWSARILQHETDHLAGTLCHDLAVPRSFVHSPYASRYADLPDAVRRLGLEGEITGLGPGEVAIG